MSPIPQIQPPTVSFIVPCYRLAHLLADCIRSILAQSYDDFEVLIMDDCSPDNTAEIAGSFLDHRVKCIRNEQNLGHLRNYNKGIALSRGKYVWLISADDRLRRPYVLERYVRLMERHPAVGYVCCPGMGMVGSVETTLVDCGYYGSRDKVFKGPRFIAASLRQGYGLLSPSVLVRKDCYDKISSFPLDLPHQADMYLWLIWALEYDVAYMAEPMVNYRSHELNMMTSFWRQSPEIIFSDEVNVLWRLKRKVEEKGLRTLARKVELSIADKYARAAISGYGEAYSQWRMDIAQCKEALRINSTSESEYRRLRGTFYYAMADRYWDRGVFEKARQSYFIAVRDNWTPPIWIKLCLSYMGPAGKNMRLRIRHARCGSLQ
ncbi:MAG: glycosyltransferase family 2 protein [Bryobacteraceae bacterium]